MRIKRLRIKAIASPGHERLRVQARQGAAIRKQEGWLPDQENATPATETSQTRWLFQHHFLSNDPGAHFLMVALALLFWTFAAASPASAHTIGISRGAYRIHGNDITTELVFARPEFAMSVPGLDSNHDGTVSSSEISAAQSQIENTFLHGLDVSADSAPCQATLQDVSPTDEDGILIRSLYHCHAEPHSVTFNLKFLASLSHGHRHLATATSGSAVTHLAAYEGNTEFCIAVNQNAIAANASWTGTVWPMFRLGIEHILTGYDHLVFLLGLILISSRVRPLLVVITAFTVAHSITLGVAALQIWTPNSLFVEPAIALSIAYIGIENWFVKDASRRWMITFPFGLIHGFGFAGALHQIALPHSEIPLALLSFNVGVETGQLAVLALALPMVFWLRRHQWFLNRGVQAISGAIALAGVLWFIVRVT